MSIAVQGDSRLMTARLAQSALTLLFAILYLKNSLIKNNHNDLSKRSTCYPNIFISMSDSGNDVCQLPNMAIVIRWQWDWHSLHLPHCFFYVPIKIIVRDHHGRSVKYRYIYLKVIFIDSYRILSLLAPFYNYLGSWH